MKGGEDVRTDERMEVILDVCNGLLARHPGAASHRLKVQPGKLLRGSQRFPVTILDERLDPCNVAMTYRPLMSGSMGCRSNISRRAVLPR